MMLSMHKHIRNRMAEIIVFLIRISGLTDNVGGFLLRSIHLHIPGYFMLLIILLPRYLALAALIPLISAFILFIYLRGCFITIAEKKLCDSDINIIDPFICIAGDKCNNFNRYYYTLIVCFVYFVCIFLILRIRGCL